jgi:lipopolysaccharide biosynthesis glycosyltransferase
MIWLDTDTIILKDIVELWNINNDYVEVYGRVDDYTWYEKYRHITKYLQTGVMLLNLELLNKNKTIDNTIKLIQTKKMYCTDMTAINKTCHSKKILSRKFNSYHWTKKAIIHHACGTWIHHGKRIQVKQDDERIFLKIHPQYKRIYDQLNKIVKMNKNLF